MDTKNRAFGFWGGLFLVAGGGLGETVRVIALASEGLASLFLFHKCATGCG